MKNLVFNFSVHANELAPAALDALTSFDPKPLSVDINMPAQEAAEMALREGKEIVLVKSDETLAGVFVPGYLQDLLPEHHLASGLDLSPAMRLPEMILRLDEADVDFHSESVNFYPTFRKCPKGHLTSGDPCPRHSVPTDPYP